MAIEPSTHKEKVLKLAWEWIETLLGNLKAKVANVANGIIKLGQDDPRRITHSIKVGIALTLVSLLYYSRPLYDGFGAAGMWAVLTVVVVFEFTVGGTLSKSLNRGFATLAACGLGVGAQHFARLFGDTGEPIVLGILVFLLATIFTFTRFVPQVKERYDYGVLVFILTFSLVSLSGFRIEELLVLAYQRLLTILIGGATCVLVSIVIFPVWAGEDLHKLVASNVEKLANYLECAGSQYGECTDISTGQSSSLQDYKSVLGSKSSEEILANLARWEPRHGRFSYNHPWNQYLNIGSLSRQCAYQIEALNGYINSSLQERPREFEIRIQESCKIMCEESSKALKSLATSMKTMTKNSVCANYHVENSKIAIKDLKSALKTCPLVAADLLSVVPAATVATILIEIVRCVEKLKESMQELSELAHFKDGDTVRAPKKSQLRVHLKPIVEEDGHEHVIVVEIDKGTAKDRANIGEIGTNLEEY